MSKLTKNQQIIKSILMKVRDAGAIDDNNGGEDWTLSDNIIARSMKEIDQIMASERLDEQNNTFARFYHDSGNPEVRYKVNEDLDIDQILRVGELKQIVKGGSDE